MATVKLSVWAKNNGIKSRTAWFQFRAGKVAGARQLATGTIVVDLPETEATRPELGVVIYARTSSSANKNLVEAQASRLESYAISRGYKIAKIVKEFGSGLNDKRPKLTEVLKANNYSRIIVEHKDRLTRFGFEWFQVMTGGRIEVVNEAKTADEDITRDLISIVHCFAAKIYSLRRKKRKIVEAIQA